MSFTQQKRKLKRIFVVLLGAYIMVGAALYYFQEKLMFLPTTLNENYVYELNYPHEELFLKVSLLLQMY